MYKEKYVQGAGGDSSSQPDAPTSTPDNLFSEDIVEFALAISEGPIRGLSRGAKSFYLGETPLVSEMGVSNFDKFAIGVHPGYPEGVAQNLNLVLGGESNNYSVGVALREQVPVTRQTEEGLRNRIDRLEVRIQIARLLVSNNSGTFNNTASFQISYKRLSASSWVSIAGSGFSTVTQDAQYVVVTNETSTSPATFNLVYINDQTDVPTKYLPDGNKTPKTYSWNSSDPSTNLTLPVVKVKRDIVVEGDRISLTGKTSSGVVKEFKIDVPRVDDDWMIRVTKFNPDNSTESFCDINWESYQCTSLKSRSYPNVAIVHGRGVATGQFSGIPEFTGVYDGRIILVPTNYNPDLRTYDDSVPWDGSFKLAWTNNPAWVLYDLLINKLYGFAAHYPYIDVNRFDFYEAARWCDELVPSLLDSNLMEPRFTYNDVLSEPRDAKEMASYIAGSFNGFIWDDLTGRIHLKVDRDDPAVALFTPENVAEDGFNYTFTDVTTRVNDISVAFINESLNWNEDRRRIPGITTDPDDINRNGRVPLDFIAVGCTSVSEAVRKARYRLISSLTETKIVSFTTTRLGVMLDLYSVILIADPGMGWSISGRILNTDGDYIYLRDPIYIEHLTNYVMKFQTPHGLVDVTVSPEEIGEVYRLKLESALPLYLPKNATFSIEETGGFGFAKPFRVMSIEEVDGTPYLFHISAIELNRSKYSSTESGIDVPELQYSYSTLGAIPAPLNVRILSGDDYIEISPNGTVNYRMQVTWDIQRGLAIDRFDAQYSRIDESSWKDYDTKGSTSFYIENVTPGQTYVARVRTVDPYGNKSQWSYSPNHSIFSSVKLPDPVSTFEAVGGLFQNKLNWTFNNFPTIKSVEIRSSIDNNPLAATLLVSLAYPVTEYVHNNLGVSTQVFYWIRVFDTEGNCSEWTGPVHAITSSDPSVLMEMLTDSISSSQLASALKSRIDLIDAADSVPGSVAARIKEATVTTTGPDSAISQSIQTIQTTLNDHTSSLEIDAQSINGLMGRYTVKVDLDGYVSGYGLASEINEGTPTSSFIIHADKFAVGLPGFGNLYPFIIGLIGGQAAVGVNGLLVVDGTVTAQKIDSRGLSIKDAQGNVILSAGNALDYNMVGGNTKPEDNATRNEHAGEWEPSINYKKGFVVSNNGSSWTASIDHYSTSSNKPPIYPITSNNFWKLNSSTGENYSIVIESTNGGIFRPGQSLNTLLIAHVFRNGVEITGTISESKFRWRRVSYFPQEAPNDDATWDANYSAGYKQIMVTTSDVASRATYHCDVLIAD